MEQKEKFKNQLEQIVSQKNKNNIYLNQHQYEKILLEVKAAKFKEKNKSGVDYRRLKRYDIIVVGMEEKLISPLNEAGSIKYFATIEETYGIIHDAHLATGHGGRNRLVKEINNKYNNITTEAVMLYLSLCEVCQKKAKAKRKGIVKPILISEMNSRCQVDLIDVPTQPDNEFKFILTKNEEKMVQPVILVHGGAGNVSDNAVPMKLLGMKKAVQRGYEVMAKGGSSLDAVQAAVEVMEDDPGFNAGIGSVLNLDGEVEMDAIVMEGTNLKTGAVGAVKRIPHPIALARLVLEKSPHVLLVGEGAYRFAADCKMKTVPAYRFVTQKAIDALEEFLRNGGDAVSELWGNVGTVGAVAVDSEGRVAVATSTGGVTGKLPGRVGDTPVPGSGGYADDKIGAVSTTGKGESIMRACVAHRILNSMKEGKPTQEATEEALRYMTSTVGDTAGAITVSNRGDIGIYFTSKRMGWAYKIGNGNIEAGVDMPKKCN